MGNLVRPARRELFNSITADTLQILNAGTSTETVFIADINEFLVNNMTVFKKLCTDTGTSQVETVTWNPKYPCDSSACDWTGGFQIAHRAQVNGEWDEFYEIFYPFYAYLQTLGTAASGYLADLDKFKSQGLIQELIINQEDRRWNSVQNVTSTLAATTVTAMTVTMTDGTTVSATGANLTATLADLVSSDTRFTGTAVVSGSQFILKCTSGMESYAVTGTTITTYDSFTFTITAIDADDFFKVSILEDMGSTTTTVEGVRPVYSRADVAREFPILRGMVASQPNIPTVNTDYCKYTFKVNHANSYALDGANHLDTVLEEVEIVLPKTVAEGANWDDELLPVMTNAGLYTPTLGTVTLATTGASGAAAGTVAIAAVTGFSYSARFYAGASNTGTINETTGVVASGTNNDVFWVEILYSHETVPRVYKLDMGTITNPQTTTGVLTTITDYEYFYTFLYDTTGASGAGTGSVVYLGAATHHTLFNGLITVVSDNYTSTGSGTVSASTGATSANGTNGDTITQTINILFNDQSYMYNSTATITSWGTDYVSVKN